MLDVERCHTARTRSSDRLTVLVVLDVSTSKDTWDIRLRAVVRDALERDQSFRIEYTEYLCKQLVQRLQMGDPKIGQRVIVDAI